MAGLENILKDALILNPTERAALAEMLLASLGNETDEMTAERLWLEEAQQRREALRAGETASVSAEDVHAKAEKMLR